MKESQRVEKAFDDIEENFRKISEKNKKELEAALIKPIHEKKSVRTKWNMCNDCFNGKW